MFGWASIAVTVDGTQLEDRQHDVIDPEDLEEAAYEYVLHFRDAGEEHAESLRKKGRLVESCVLTREKQAAMGLPEGILPEGWWIGFRIDDDDAWEKVKNGTYRMFSIEGTAERTPVEKASREPTGCGVLVLRDGKVLTGTRIERAALQGPGESRDGAKAPFKRHPQGDLGAAGSIPADKNQIRGPRVSPAKRVARGVCAGLAGISRTVRPRRRPPAGRRRRSSGSDAMI